ncbi:hypothetical protein WJX81_000820 [Elliptochloris bilobata]|uniref:Dienelactone hydrolase domain-containing protein n=1 Tax=Elliptochloris bilobata TaxID=381761 RepID=A0AAW1SDB2_9CHLO
MAEFKQCCDPGTEWDGTPKGMVSSIAGLSAYLSKPENPLPGTPAIFLIHDVFGWELKNVRLFADKMAQQGFLTVVPDLFHNQAMKPMDWSKLPVFLAKFPVDKCLPEAKAVVKALREEHGASAVGAQGFCWGGKYAALLLAGPDGTDAGVISHGSLLSEQDIKAIERPVWFQFSDNDKQIPKDFRLQIEEMLKTKPGCGSKFYEGQEHGWTMRGDEKDSGVAAAAADAFKGALEFFRARLGAK